MRTTLKPCLTIFSRMSWKFSEYLFQYRKFFPCYGKMLLIKKHTYEEYQIFIDKNVLRIVYIFLYLICILNIEVMKALGEAHYEETFERGFTCLFYKHNAYKQTQPEMIVSFGMLLIIFFHGNCYGQSIMTW